MAVCWMDGELMPADQARVSVFDHGLLYGDGVFEGIRFYQGRAFRLQAHLQRLADSARAILLDIPAAQTSLTPYDLFTADECFLTGTGAELIPVGQISGRPLPVERPVFDRLQVAFHHLVRHEGAPVSA